MSSRAFASTASSAASRRLVFLGAPGVGKGTFAGRIAKLLGVPAISTGDILREEIKAGTPLGAKVKGYTTSGKLVPDEVVTAVVKERLQHSDALGGFILDGYPRTVRQAMDLDAFQSISRVVNITLPEHVLMAKMLARRVCADCGRGYNIANIQEGDLDMPPLLPKPSDCDKCVGKPRLVQREDDTEAVVRDRLVIYTQQTAPLIDFYARQGKLIDFAVKRGIDDVPRLAQALGV